jgi:2-iminobutanoate/2-iminopropanoate deaminase
MIDKQVATSAKVPKPVAPYSPGIRVGELIFVAGQIGLDVTTGALVPGGVEAETSQALHNMENVLEAAGATLENVVKTTVFLRDMKDFGQVNAIYAQFFTDKPPARSAFQVAALPLGAAVEIEAIAIADD